MTFQMSSGGFVLLGLVAAVIAAHKGRSFAAWLVIGLLLGPFAFLASLFLSSKTPSAGKGPRRG